MSKIYLKMFIFIQIVKNFLIHITLYLVEISTIIIISYDGDKFDFIGFVYLIII